MSYTYGMKAMPSVSEIGGPGAVIDGIVKESIGFTTILTAGSGVLQPIPRAKFMRVAVTGGGGSGSGRYVSPWTQAGGGGGCAASKIVPASTIYYTVGAAGAKDNNGGNSIAQFNNYFMIGVGGRAGLSYDQNAFGFNNNGGWGIGGDYNNSGDPGSVASSTTQPQSITFGGGAAGPLDLVNGIFIGWGAPKGVKTSGLPRQAGGGGTGAPGPAIYSTTLGTPSYPTGWPWGNSAGFEGGAGGGGGSSDSFQTTGSGSAGGVGGLFVEWFS